MSCPRANQGGFLGSYVPPQQPGVACPLYVKPGDGSRLAGAQNQRSQSAPLDPHFGLSTRSMFPSSSAPGEGWDQVLVSAPTDLLAADGLLMDGLSLTTNRHQSRDLRGDVPVALVYSTDEQGRKQIGPFGGMLEGDGGNMDFRTPQRTFIM